MSFTAGFTKTAGFGAGLRAAGKETIQEALTLKGMRDSARGLKKYKGRMKDLFKTKAGRDDLGEAIGKSLPSAAAATMYTAAAKKSYDKMNQQSQNSYDDLNYYR